MICIYLFFVKINKLEVFKKDRRVIFRKKEYKNIFNHVEIGKISYAD